MTVVQFESATYSWEKTKQPFKKTVTAFHTETEIDSRDLICWAALTPAFWKALYNEHPAKHSE